LPAGPQPNVRFRLSFLLVRDDVAAQRRASPLQS